MSIIINHPPESPEPDDLMTTAEMEAQYQVVSFCAPFVVVVRKSDGVSGTLEFGGGGGVPRRYFGFKARS